MPRRSRNPVTLPAARAAGLLLLAGALGAGRTVTGEDLRLGKDDVLEKRGLSVLVFNSEYNGMFFDEKTSALQIIHHGVRTATGGAVRLNPTPEQWDPIPKMVERKVDPATRTIDVLLRYEDYDFDSHLVVRPSPGGFTVSVVLDKPVPGLLEGRAGLNLEFLPSAYFEKTYLVDGEPGIFPLYPSGPMRTRPAATRLRQFAGHSTFDDHGRAEYVEPLPIATGHTLVLAPGDPERRVTIEAGEGELSLLDGRNVAQNGWYVVRTVLPSGKAGTVAEWAVRPHTIPGWTRPPVVGFSQAGYHPAEKKVAVVELDPADTPLPAASVFQVTADGQTTKRLDAKVVPWGRYLRYDYATFDFSDVREPGLYFLQYGEQKTDTFPIAADVYRDIWHPTLDVWFPVQMDHVFVNEAYRVWHGAPHLDDARQAPVDHQHFDGYRMGDATDTSYAPGEHIPGLNVGGWFDAGDFDIRTPSQSATVLHMVETWERFRPARDETLVDEAGRYVDIHHPDGTPDLLQQIEHGALQLVAQHRAFGRAIPGIIVPHLHQYHHLGDAVDQTDGLVYDPDLAPGEKVGGRSGTPDDRWAFTNRSPATNYVSAAALAAASRALRGHDDGLADECLAAARKAWSDERAAAATGPAPSAWEARFRAGAELTATLQLLITTNEKVYADRFDELVWPALAGAARFTLGTALRALPALGPAYKEKLRPYAEKYRDEIAQLETQNPYGVPIGTGGWAGNSQVIAWAHTNALLHAAYPDLVTTEQVLRGLHYVLGRHPASSVSFVSAVGTRSKKVAYGNNRADYTFIAGGVVPGVLVLKPDFPENKEDWPFLWGENEYVIDICAHYVLLAHLADELVTREATSAP